MVDAPVRAGLLWADRYESGMGSLGFQWAWQQLNVPAVVSCERFLRIVQDPTTSARQDRRSPRGAGVRWSGGDPAPFSVETGRPLGGCDLHLASISYELDFVNLAGMLAAGGVEPERERRGPEEPALVIGGPLTRANPLPLGAMADVVVIGDGEPAVDALVRHIRAGGMTDASSVVQALRGVDGVWLPALDAMPPPACEAGASCLPVVSAVSTPHSSFPDLTLVEISRGCPKSCTFCLGRKPDLVAKGNPALRIASTESILSSLPADLKGVGIIGAALSYHPGLETILDWLARRELKAGLSSLRADRVTPELARLLKATGGEVLTVAADGISERVRSALRKDVAEQDMVRCAELGKEAGIHALKIYAMIGLPDETDDDVLEFAGLLNRLNTQLPVIASLSVFVPKKGTPLENAPFGPVDAVSARLQLLRRSCSGGIRFNRMSAREAEQQWVFDHASLVDGVRMIRDGLPRTR